ncbi:MAG: pseudouridine synthase [Candidatus Schmidhempelia sp.]|nr:pseudouridine synthase [Candidatus Schmidhempelia sp.]
MTTPLIAFNKPYGVICQFSGEELRPTLKHYIEAKGYYPAGRLDTDSEGLLLLTNDGRLQAKIAEPKYKLPKTYWVQVEGTITELAILQLAEGVQLKEFISAPAKVLSIPEPENLWQRDPPIRQRKHIPTSWLSITINEGKNRQVRRMCASVGFPCLRLLRVQIGKLNLFTQNLALGQWQYIETNML